jgi:cyclomaltodextrinase / maltogenic alpha-amylase / neopullulanase
MFSTPIRKNAQALTTLLALILLALCTQHAQAYDGRSPVIRLDIGQTAAFTAPDLGLQRLPDLKACTFPDGLTLSFQEQNGTTTLTLLASRSMNWELLHTPHSDFLIKTSARLPVLLQIDARAGERVCCFGSFNGWNRGSHVLSETAPGHYELQCSLPPGDHQYLFVVGSHEMLDPSNPDSIANGLGGFNSRLLLESPSTDKLRLRRLGWVQRSDHREMRFACSDAAAKGQVSALHGNHLLAPAAISWQGDTLMLRVPNEVEAGPDILRVGFSSVERQAPLQTIFFSTAFRWEDAMVYALMPDRFRNGDTTNDDIVKHPKLLAPANWHGGDLLGIQSCIDENYFQELGVNTLWLYPVNETTDLAWQEYPEPHRFYTGYHGYWPTHPTRIDSRFGEEKDLHGIVSSLHAKDMRIIMDLVANHVHEEHPWVSEHPDWLGQLELPDGTRNLRIWDEHRLTTWFEPYMPDIDYSHSPPATVEMSKVGLYWLNHYNLDGFRHDAVKHVPRVFWNALTAQLYKKTREQKTPIYQIGETFGSDELIQSYISPAAMDAQFNFNLYHPAREIFLNETRSFSELALILEQNLASYGQNNLMGNLMDSHDKSRYAGFADGDLSLTDGNLQEIGWTNPPVVDHKSTYRKLQLYLTYLYALPGVPFLYYGDEIGMTGAADPDNRRMMRFDAAVTADEAWLLEETKALIKMRRDRPELRRGDLEILLSDHEVLIFMRSAEGTSGQSSRTLVALNKSASPQNRELDLPLSLGQKQIKLAAYQGQLIIVKN